jgi:hypothetical protein
MADKEISALTAVGTPLDGTELVHVVEGGNSRKATTQDIADLAEGIPSGNAFPDSPASGDRFYRDDRNIDYFYDGTRWLSTQIYSHSITTSLISGISATTTFYSPNPWWNLYSIYVEKFSTKSLNTSANTSTAYFTVRLQEGDGASTNNLGSGLSGQGDGNTAFVGHEETINAVVASTVEVLQITATETGAAGSTWITSSITYRLVG